MIQRMIKLHQAVNDKAISASQLKTISAISAVELEEVITKLFNKTLDLSNPNLAALSTFFATINTNLDSIAIDDSAYGNVEATLKQFDSEHGDYLPLQPLVIENERSLALALNDFAAFYPLFIQHLSVKKEPSELGDKYSVKIDSSAAKLTWLQWKSTRPIRLEYDPRQAEFPGLIEKFLAGRLNPQEWLSDIDMQRAFSILNLTDKNIHIVRLKADDIGLTLHFEREKHEQDDPKAPYTIPLILNLGEDKHSRIDSKGVHWTRLLVTVDPRHVPPLITAKYSDELELPQASKKTITETITKAITYHEQIGDYSSDSKIYSAYPACNQPIIEVTGSGEQNDTFTCGHRALRGLIKDLIDQNQLAETPQYKAFIDCDTSVSLRNFVSQTLIGEQNIGANDCHKITARLGLTFSSPDAHGYCKIDQELVKGQLLAFDQPTHRGKGWQLGKKFDSDHLKTLVARNKAIIAFRETTPIKELQGISSDKTTLNLDLPDIISKMGASEDSELALDIIFKAVLDRPSIKEISLNSETPLSDNLLAALKNQMVSLPSTLKLTSENPQLEAHLVVINARNTLLNELAIQDSGQDPWDQIYSNLLFDLPATKATGQTLDFVDKDSEIQANAIGTLGRLGFEKLLQYASDNEGRFVNSNCPYQTFSMANALKYSKGFPSSLDLLQALNTHLQSASPFVPFKHFIIPIRNLSEIDQASMFDEIKKIVMLNTLPLEKIEIKTSSLKNLDTTQIEKLIAFVKNNPAITTVISFSTHEPSPVTAKLAELENASIKNKRNAIQSATGLRTGAHVKKSVQKIALGKIGKAIFATEDLGTLASEVQVQEQQQQVQQQIQTALNNDELPDADPIEDEAFTTYSGVDEQLDRDSFIKTMGEFVRARHPHLTPGMCWDLITGDNAHLFKYGICKMTVSAAKMLVEHLSDVQYGLHPDNLPRGFSLQQDKGGKVVVNYNQVNPIINPNESPLTLQFSTPRPANAWSGNMLQFMTEDQSIELYKTFLKQAQKPKPTIEECNSTFFFLKDYTKPSISPTLRHQILKGMIDGAAMSPKQSDEIKKLITDVFDVKLTNKNIVALGEILYEQNPQVLSDFLNSLQQLKKDKGSAYFESFKTCFIDSSENLNELTNKESKASIEKIRTFSPTQMTWWKSLTEQHTSNINYQQEQPIDSNPDFTLVSSIQPGQRWANLAELTSGFDYFCAQLEEVSPGLKLTQFCPLTGVADMRVALDRLVSTILPNAHNVNEQFYESLTSLPLDALGPFYASRYEGFKLVSSEMQLHLGALTKNAGRDLYKAQDGFCYRFEKDKVIMAFTHSNSAEMNKALLKRYIATFNHRASSKSYDDAYNRIIRAGSQYSYYMLIILAAYGTGKRGKYFTDKDIDNLAGLSRHGTKARLSLSEWVETTTGTIKTTIAESVTILELGISDPSGGFSLFIPYAAVLIADFNDSADIYHEALGQLADNPKKMPLENFQGALWSILQEEEPTLDFSTITAEKPLASAITKLMAVCDGQLLSDSEAAATKIFALHRQVQACLEKHAHQTTKDMLELLGNIDTKSAALPTIEQLTGIVLDITNLDAKPDYNTLEREIKEKLPESCAILTQKVTAVQLKSTGNLHSIISKHMGGIIEQLESRQGLIDEALGEGFYASLSTPRGPRALMHGLENIGNLPDGLVSGIAQNQVLGLMRTVYTSVSNEGISSIGLTDGQTRGLLTKIINTKLNHKVKTTDDFKAFTGIYASETEALGALLGHLKSLNQKWPTSFNAILASLDNCASINMYPIRLLEKITGAFAINFDEKKPFPALLFKSFFNIEPLTAEKIQNLGEIIDTVFNIDDDTLKADERELLCKLALKHCQAVNEALLAYFLTQLMDLKKTDPEIFKSKLTFILATNDIHAGLIQVPAYISDLKKHDPELMPVVVDFFAKEEIENFIRFMTLVSPLNDKSSSLITIALKAAQKKGSYDHAKMTGLFNTQFSRRDLDKKDIAKLAQLYQSPNHPDIDVLIESLSLPVLDINDLEARLDRDPFRLRTDPATTALTLTEQFSTEHITGYLDELKDLYYDRPLLLSQRQALQKWLLYINTIGQMNPIPTTPWDTVANKAKPVIEMSHSEIQGLLKHYRLQFQNKSIRPEQRTKDRLECIAILSEAMYRGTGKYPRKTQLIYLLNSMQQSGNYIAQIQTGQGKSLTAALAAAMTHLEGHTVDLCTSTLSLANEGLDENKAFFEYLGIPVRLINAESSSSDDYQQGAIHYSSLSEIALYRSKMTLQGKIFSDDSVLIADEVDFSTLDDNTRYRNATSLDAVTDPYKSPYTWVYESLVQFVDAQKTPMSDGDFLNSARQWLIPAAKTKAEKTQLKHLESTLDVYNKRLETWLIASAKTSQLIALAESRFRVIPLEHKKYGRVSKACILSNSEPRIAAEYSDAIHQFLHTRLRQKYQAAIAKGSMPDFLVEPEKAYVTSLNSKLLMKKYSRIMGMSGTAGSMEEIHEQYAKYGFRFTDICPYVESQLRYLPPILTNPKLIVSSDLEEQDHIGRIVREAITHISRGTDRLCGPMLIQCANKTEGEKIHQALRAAIEIHQRDYQGRYRTVQQYYSSEKPTPAERNDEENKYKTTAGESGVITISTVFARGTDIKPPTGLGLYAVQTYVDTKPYSAEDLERSKKQKAGRAGRQGEIGSTRMIVRRSEFKDVYNVKAMRNIPNTVTGINIAIHDLNINRNQSRTLDRNLRESFDDIKDIAYQKFLKFITVINTSDPQILKQAVRDKLLKHWSLFLGDIDAQWDELQHLPALQGNLEAKIKGIAEFTCERWEKIAQENGVLHTDLLNWSNHNKISGMTLPKDLALNALDIIAKIRTEHPNPSRQHIKHIQINGPVDPSVSEDAVYCDFMALNLENEPLVETAISASRARAVGTSIANCVSYLSSDAHFNKLQGKFNLRDVSSTEPEKVKHAMGALLYLRYKAYRDGNPLAHAELKVKCDLFISQICLGKNAELTAALAAAQADHFTKLMANQRKPELDARKIKYLELVMAEWQTQLPKETETWKRTGFPTWWNGTGTNNAMKHPVIQWLTSYRDNWWSRLWVSSDHKQIVTNLLANINAYGNGSSKDILAMISAARHQILADDSRNKRSMDSGINGRLYQYLNSVEARVVAASTAQELDTDVVRQLNDIKVVLSSFASLNYQDLNNTIESLNTAACLDAAGNVVVAEVTRQYQRLSALMTSVNLMSLDEPRFESKEWRTLDGYCGEKSRQLVSYFKQCDKLSTINKCRSVQVYQAASESSAIIVNKIHGIGYQNQVVHRLEQADFSYKNDRVAFKIAENATNKTLKNQIHNALAYTELLSALEESIVERADGETLIRFKTLTLGSSERFTDGFQLTISLEINGKATLVHYNFDSNNPTAYIDNESLADLDNAEQIEPDIGETPVNDVNVGEFLTRADSLEAEGAPLRQEARAARAASATAHIALTHDFKQQTEAIKERLSAVFHNTDKPELK